MAMVGVDDSSLQADSQSKSVDFIWGSAAALILYDLFYIHQLNRVNSRNITVSWWHHHDHCLMHWC